MPRSSGTVNLKVFTRIVPVSTVRSIGTTSMSLVTMSNRHSPALPKAGDYYLDRRTEALGLKTVGYVEGIATAADSYVTAFAK